MPFYAVRIGRKPGIYNTWSECRKQVDNFSDAKYRQFETKTEAMMFINGFDNPGGACSTPTKATPTRAKVVPTPTRSAPYMVATPTSSSTTAPLSSGLSATCTETSQTHSIDYQLKLTDTEIILLKEKLAFMQNKKKLLLAEKTLDEKKLKLAREESQLKLKEHQLRTDRKTPDPKSSCDGNTGASFNGNRIVKPVEVTGVKNTNTSSGQNVVNQQQSKLDVIEKCRNFLSAVIKTAAARSQATARLVLDLIQGLIDDKVQPEFFSEQLQKALKSSAQPHLTPFLKKILPRLRQSLLRNEISIKGVRPPPVEVLQQQNSSSSQSTSIPHTQGVPKSLGISNPSSKPTSTDQIESNFNKASVANQMNIGDGNVPRTYKASQSQVAGCARSPSPASSHSSHKRKKNFK